MISILQYWVSAHHNRARYWRLVVYLYYSATTVHSQSSYLSHKTVAGDLLARNHESVCVVQLLAAMHRIGRHRLYVCPAAIGCNQRALAAQSSTIVNQVHGICAGKNDKKYNHAKRKRDIDV